MWRARHTHKHSAKKNTTSNTMCQWVSMLKPDIETAAKRIESTDCEREAKKYACTLYAKNEWRTIVIRDCNWMLFASCVCMCVSMSWVSLALTRIFYLCHYVEQIRAHMFQYKRNSSSSRSNKTDKITSSYVLKSHRN